MMMVGANANANPDSRRLAPLPSCIADAIQTLSWPLDLDSLSPMHLEPLERLEEIGSPFSGGVLSLVALLKQHSRTQYTGMDNTNTEYWSRITAALILLGHGHCDEAHNLVGPLSYPRDLPYYYGPPMSTSPDICAAASVVHCLVHRLEGPCLSEFEKSGFENSNFWAGAALRSGGEETLPLRELKGEVVELANNYTHARQWLQTEFCCLEWDPRPVTKLCEAVLLQQQQESSEHVLHTFAEQAAVGELRVMLRHALDKLGYDTANQSKATRPSTTILERVG